MPEPAPRPPVGWNVCPDCLGRHEGGAACLDEPPTGDLSERLDAALRTVGLARNLAAYRDAVLPVVEEALAEEHDRAVLAEAALRDHGAKLAAEMRYGQQQYDRAERVRQELGELSDYMAGWTDEHDAEVTAHEIQTMRTAAKEIRRILAALDADQPKETT